MLRCVPRLWTQTIETHRREVRDAILDSTAALVAEKGLRSVTMSQIAKDAGIGRATLYKYFGNVESILSEWHERHVGSHLDRLVEMGAGPGAVDERLRAVLGAYGLIRYETSQRYGGTELAFVHRGDHVALAHHRLGDLLLGLLAEGATKGELRDDVAPEELALYCMHALTAADLLVSESSVRRLVAVTMAGLRG